MIGIRNQSPGIGDKIQFAALPENYFLTKGEKLVDLDGCWVWDHNPYILRDTPVDQEIDLWTLKIPQDHRLSQQERFAVARSARRLVRSLCGGLIRKFREISNSVAGRDTGHARAGNYGCTTLDYGQDFE